jgi:hypothetical protein
MRSLKNESTGSAKTTWASVDKAASRTPGWAKDHVNKVASAKATSIGNASSITDHRQKSK